MYGGSVLFDSEERIFKMWYRSSGPISRKPGALEAARTPEGTGRATRSRRMGWSGTSRTWAHRSSGASTRNNLLPPSADGMQFIRRPNLVKDYDDPDPARRYKMVYMDYVDGAWGLSKAYSPDGIRWKMNVGCAAPIRAGSRAERHSVRGGTRGWSGTCTTNRKSDRVRADVGREDHPAQVGGDADREPRLRDLGRDD